MGKRVIKDFIQFAIANEQKAAELYEKYSEIVEPDSTKGLLKFMADMEKSHEARLKELYENKTDLDLDKPVEVELSTFEVSSKIDENSSIYEVFNYAIEAEQKAHDLYERLADLDFDINIRSFFALLSMATTFRPLAAIPTFVTTFPFTTKGFLSTSGNSTSILV